MEPFSGNSFLTAVNVLARHLFSDKKKAPPLVAQPSIPPTELILLVIDRYKISETVGKMAPRTPDNYQYFSSRCPTAATTTDETPPAICQ